MLKRISAAWEDLEQRCCNFFHTPWHASRHITTAFRLYAVAGLLFLCVAIASIARGYVSAVEGRSEQSGKAWFRGSIVSLVFLALVLLATKLHVAKQRDRHRRVRAKTFNLKTFPAIGAGYLSDPVFQLCVSWIALTAYLLSVQAGWWKTLGETEVRYTFDNLQSARLPGVLFMTTPDDDYQASLASATQPPACGFLTYYPGFGGDCSEERYKDAKKNQNNNRCNCTQYIYDNGYSGTASLSGSFANLYHFSAPFQVSEAHTLVQYWLWPDKGPKQTNSNLSTVENCSRNSLSVAFYDADSTLAQNQQWDDILQQERMIVHSIPAGSIYDVQVMRETMEFRNKTKDLQTFYSPTWAPAIPTGDCSIAFSLSYSIMMQRNGKEVPVQSADDYVGRLGGILALIQTAVLVAFWMILLVRDMVRVDPDT